MDVKSVNYVAVVRRGDNVILGQRVHIPTAVDYVEYTRKVIGSAGWASVETDKLTLSDGENCFFVLIDPSGIAFIAIASKHYPARYVYDSADGSVAGLLGGVYPRLARSLHARPHSCPRM